MKVFASDNTIQKLEKMFTTQTPGQISIRKVKPGDPDTHIFDNLKLPEKYRPLHKTGKCYNFYINEAALKKLEKQFHEGGVLPLIPLILGGISALGALTGGAAGITKTVLDKKANDIKNEEEARHNREMEKIAKGDGVNKAGNGIYLSPYQKGNGLKETIRDFVNATKLDDIGKKAFRNVLKNVSDYVGLEKQGNGIFMNPYPS